MKTITFTCETITPLFLAGADGTTPELRAPSIKGALRFWWRAMNGHLPLDDEKDSTGKTIKEGLKTLEGKIFGNTSARSSFAIHITQSPNDKKEVGNDFWDEIDFVEKTSQKGKKYKEPKNHHRGIHYLLYSTFLNERKYYKAKASVANFTFTISFQKSEYYEYLINSLTGLLLFGALGTRSRRGGGSFRVTKVTLEGFEDKGKSYQVFEELLLQINTVEKLREHYQKSTSFLPKQTNTSYSVLKGSKVYFFEPVTNWKDALERIGKPFYEFRKGRQGDISDTPNLGFPILHNKSKVTMMAGQKTKKGQRDELELLERRASPLLFKVIQTKAGFFPLIIWLNGELIPDGFNIMDKTGENKKPPSTKIIQEFIDTLKPLLSLTL